MLVSADFPAVTSEKRKKIYECLEQNKWVKVHEPGRDISTVWYASFAAGVTEASAIRITKDDFDKCSAPIQPKLIMQFGPSMPTRHNLT